MDISLVVNITAKAWALPILWNLDAGVPGRQAPLLAATGANRTAFGQSLNHLIQLGIIERNPGYGHPLRPEFRLTKLGETAARMASRIRAATGDEKNRLLRRAWTVPILSQLAEPNNFGAFKRQLPMITDRALSQSLKLLETHDWVVRDVDVAARPPKPIYYAINEGVLISQATNYALNTVP